MQHKKGLIILIAIGVISVIFGAKSIFSKLTSKPSFSFSFSSSNDFDDEFGDGFENDFDDDFSSNGAIGKIINIARNKNSDEPAKSTKQPYIAVIHIRGVISEENKNYNQKWLLKQIKKAKNDKNNRLKSVLYTSIA